MLYLVLSALMLSSNVFSQIGEVIQAESKSVVFIQTKEKINSDDEQQLLFIYPRTQIILNVKSQISFQTQDEAYLSKGMSKIKLGPYQKEAHFLLKSKDVSFQSSESEFVVSVDGHEVHLDVREGEVEVSSPLVMTFVPEIVKADEGFTFDRKNKKFIRRSFTKRFEASVKFLSNKDLELILEKRK